AGHRGLQIAGVLESDGVVFESAGENRGVETALAVDRVAPGTLGEIEDVVTVMPEQFVVGGGAVERVTGLRSLNRRSHPVYPPVFLTEVPINTALWGESSVLLK